MVWIGAATTTAWAQTDLSDAPQEPPPSALKPLLVAAPEAVEDAYRLGDGLRGEIGPVDIRFRGRLHAELVEPFYDDFEEELGTEFGTETAFRRVRGLFDLRGAECTGFENVRLRAQIGFRDSTLRWFDLYARVDDVFNRGSIEASDVRFGEFREPFGLEAMTSVTYLPFIERSTATNVFTPGRSRGVQASARTSGALFQMGAFHGSEGRPFPDELSGEVAVTARALWQPGGPGWVQLGGSVSYRDPRGSELAFRGRTGTSLLDRFADTGPIEVDAATVVGLEALWRRGRWTAQAEWFGNWINGAGGEPGEAFLQGGYASVAAFLGEGRSTWNRMRGSGGAPDTPRHGESGQGALEAVARVSWTDLDDGAVQGGRVLDAEAGLNWYLTPTTRVMLHWLGVQADVDGSGNEYGSAILGRIQVQI
ncbi:MAG: OprO/OprP family phosphate-selective porin [Planctomycetota bacterium]|jgi:phosphate-selective porin OprO/OprP